MGRDFHCFGDSTEKALSHAEEAPIVRSQTLEGLPQVISASEKIHAGRRWTPRSSGPA